MARDATGAVVGCASSNVWEGPGSNNHSWQTLIKLGVVWGLHVDREQRERDAVAAALLEHVVARWRETGCTKGFVMAASDAEAALFRRAGFEAHNAMTIELGRAPSPTSPIDLLRGVAMRQRTCAAEAAAAAKASPSRSPSAAARRPRRRSRSPERVPPVEFADYEPSPDTVWRFGRPNYARVNKAYFQYRTKIHPEGSLESIVNKLVKNWEVESHHIADAKQWKTMDTTKFKAALNGGCPVDAQTMADIGPYNMLIGETDKYSAKALSFEDSNRVFGSTFTEGFAWECLEVFSGPPDVSFRWRHFGKFTGKYVDDRGRVHKGDGRLIEVVGMCTARLSEALQIEELQVFYDPNSQIQPLMQKPRNRGGLCPFSRCREESEGEEEGSRSHNLDGPRMLRAAPGSAQARRDGMMIPGRPMCER